MILSVKPKYLVVIPRTVLESGFKLQSFQTYWGLGTTGAVLQGIKVNIIDKKNTTNANVKE